MPQMPNFFEQGCKEGATMFKKLQRQIERKRDGKVPLKFQFDVRVVDVTGLPSTVDNCRVVWARGSKFQTTKVRGAREGAVHFDEVLSQVATIYRASTHFEAKEYSFKIQAPAKKAGPDLLVTIGRATLNLAQYASLEAKTYEVTAPIKFKFGDKNKTALMSFVINTTIVKGLSHGDSMTEASGLSAFTGMTEMSEQDLQGFDPDAVQPVGSRSMIERKSYPLSQPAISSPPVPVALVEGPEVLEVGDESSALTMEKQELVSLLKKLEKARDILQVKNAKLSMENEELLKTRGDLEKEKKEISNSRMELEQELTLRASMENELKAEMETLETRLSQVRDELEEQQLKYSKELARVKETSAAALEEAEIKIHDAEQKLEKERKDHQNRVNLLEEDTSQLSQQLFYEKNAMDAERRKFVMAEQNWRQMKQTMELELAEAKASLSGFDSDSQIEFSVDIYDGSMDLTDPPQSQMVLSAGDGSGSTSRSQDESFSSREISHIDSNDAALRHQISAYKAKVSSLRGSLRGSLQSVDFAEQNCREAAEKLQAMEAERNELKGQLVLVKGRLNNLDQRQREETMHFHNVQGELQGNMEELEAKNRHLQDIVFTLEADLEVLRVESERMAQERESINSQLAESYMKNDDMSKAIDTLRRDKSTMGDRLAEMEGKLEQANAKLETDVIRMEEARGKLLGAQEDKLDLLQKLEEEVKTRDVYAKNMEEAVAEKKRVSVWNAKLEQKVSKFRGELNNLATVLSEELEVAKRKLRESQNAFEKMKMDRDALEQLLAEKGRKGSKFDAEKSKWAVDEVRNNFSSKERTPEVTNSFFAGLEAELKLELADSDLESTEAVEKLKIQIDDLQGTNASLVAEKSALLAEIDAIRACMMQLKDDCAQYKHGHKDFKAKSKSCSLACLNDIQSKSMETQIREANVHALETANSELKLALEDAEAEIAELRRRLQELENEVHLGKESCDSIAHELSLSQEENQELHRKLDAAIEASGRLEKVEAELGLVRHKSEKIPELEGELTTVWDAAQRLEDEDVLLRTKLSEYEMDREKRHSRWDSQLELVARVPELEALVESLQKANQGLERSISRKKKDIETLQTENNRLRLDLQHSEDRHLHGHSVKGEMILHMEEEVHTVHDTKSTDLELQLNEMKQDLESLTQLRDKLCKEKESLQEALEAESRIRKKMQEELDHEGNLRCQMESELASHAVKLAYAEKSVSELNAELQEAQEKLRESGDKRAGVASEESAEIMQELVMAKIRVAELQEINTIMSCDLFKSQEQSKKLATEIAKLETMVTASLGTR